MAKGFYVSKALGICAVVLTLSAIAGIVTMIIVYRAEISGLNPTPRPTFAPTTPFPTGPPPEMRLPGDLVPESYALFLQPHFYARLPDAEVNATNPNQTLTSPNQTLTFTGNSTVDFRCVQRTMTIFVHSKNLSVTEVTVTDRDADEPVEVLERHHHEATDFLEIQLGAVLEPEGNYSLFTAFQGEMTEDSPMGLYISNYKEEGDLADGDDGNRWVAASQLQPADARRVFPCFDEPALKATFLVTVVHRRGTTALGNSEQSDNKILDDEWEITSFHRTQKMSTYLLAFVVSEFKSVRSTALHERVEIKIYARPAAIEAGQADYAASIAGKILSYFEGLFEIDFPQRKLDHVAVSDMGGAMENWGLIIYGELELLYDEKSTSLQKEHIASIIAHELAHQWFGNLVTCNWWNEIWLNEGFASYMTYFAVDNVEPSWNIKDVWALSHLDDALEWDSTNASHPLNAPMDTVQTPDQINEMFSTITYVKGALVLRMLADLLTQRVFNKGVNMYLNAFQYQTTTSTDLWHHMQKAENDDGGHTKVAEVMDSWTNQIGYPVITINTTTGEVYQKSAVTDSDVVWHVPIRVRSHTSEASLVMLEDTSDVVIKGEFISKHGEWVLANINCAGYYKVNYNPENWDRLFAQLERNLTVIPLINRGQLVSDAFNLAKNKLVNVTLALNATRFLRNEREYLPWVTAVNNLRYFKDMFDRSEVFGAMQAYMRKQVRGLYYHVQRNDTDCLHNCTVNCTVSVNCTVPPPPLDFSQQHLQNIAIGTACANELPECVEMATKKFKDWMTTSINRIDPDLRYTIYCQAVAAGGEAEWEFLWTLYLNSSVFYEKDMYLNALSCTRKVWLLNRFLEYSLDLEKIRKLYVVDIVSRVAKNEAGLALAWNFIRAHHSDMPENQCLACMVGEVSAKFSTEFELYEVKQFQKEANITDSTYMEVHIERVEANIVWVRENKHTVLEWFRRESAS